MRCTLFNISFVKKVDGYDEIVIKEGDQIYLVIKPDYCDRKCEYNLLRDFGKVFKLGFEVGQQRAIKQNSSTIFISNEW